MAWRVTFVESGFSSIATVLATTAGRAITGTPSISASPRMEVRGSNGAIIRLGSGGEFTLVDSPLGQQPQFYGEVFVSRENPAKYRTSCWIGRSPSSASIDYFVKALPGQPADQYFALLGDLVVFEFDQNGKPFDIVSVPEGTSATVSYTRNPDGTYSYTSSAISPIADADYDYILENYVDPRRWR